MYLVHQKFTLSLVQITSSKWLQTPAVCRQGGGARRGKQRKGCKTRPRVCEITIQPLHCHGQTFLCLSETVPIDTAAPVLREVFTWRQGCPVSREAPSADNPFKGQPGTCKEIARGLRPIWGSKTDFGNRKAEIWKSVFGLLRQHRMRVLRPPTPTHSSSDSSIPAAPPLAHSLGGSVLVGRLYPQ